MHPPMLQLLMTWQLLIHLWRMAMQVVQHRQGHWLWPVVRLMAPAEDWTLSLQLEQKARWQLQLTPPQLCSGTWM